MTVSKFVALLFALAMINIASANQIDSVQRHLIIPDSIKSLTVKQKKLSSHIRFLTTVPQMKSLKVTRIPQYTSYKNGESHGYYSNPAMNYITTQRSFNAYRSYKW